MKRSLTKISDLVYIVEWNLTECRQILLLVALQNLGSGKAPRFEMSFEWTPRRPFVVPSLTHASRVLVALQLPSRQIAWA